MHCVLDQPAHNLHVTLCAWLTPPFSRLSHEELYLNRFMIFPGTQHILLLLPPLLCVGIKSTPMIWEGWPCYLLDPYHTVKTETESRVTTAGTWYLVSFHSSLIPTTHSHIPDCQASFQNPKVSFRLKILHPRPNGLTSDHVVVFPNQAFLFPDPMVSSQDLPVSFSLTSRPCPEMRKENRVSSCSGLAD